MQVILASNNQHKLAEFKNLFAHAPIKIIPQQEFNVPEAVETGLTFVENAILKARNACKYTNLPAIADDSGLAVAALNGKPGIYSARFAGKNATQPEHTNKLLAALVDIPTNKRDAKFHCALVFMRNETDPAPIIAHTTWQGVITHTPQGKHGFGYDPIFFVPQFNCTAAELTAEVKNAHSHRGKAMQLLLLQMRHFFN